MNHFKVKGTRKKLEKAARRSKKRKLGGEEIMEGAKDIIMEKVIDYSSIILLSEEKCRKGWPNGNRL